VIAARKCDDARAAFSFVQLRDAVVGTAKFERPHALQVLGFEKDLRARPLVQRARRYDGRAVCDTAQPFRRGANVVVRY